MRSNNPATGAFALGIIACVFINGCKLHEGSGKTEISVTTDTITRIDTTAGTATLPADTAAKPVQPVVAAHIPLTLTVTNLPSADAPVVVGIYKRENKFPDPNGQLKVYTFKPHGNELTAQITDQDFGSYALAIYQDVNSNGKIDKNLIGIPTEPYAFSNNLSPP